jgi:hypothetical protein
MRGTLPMLPRKDAMIRRTLVAVSFVLLQAAFAEGQSEKSAPTVPAKVLTLEQVWALDATYRDPQHGVSFQYPSVWKAGTGFGYLPPVIADGADGRQPTAGFAYSEGGFPRDHVVGPYSATNLEGFGVVYSATRATDASACEATAASLSQSSKDRDVVLGGRSFSERSTSGAGMSNSESGKLYAIFVRPICYLFETGSETTSAADGVQNLTAEQLQLIDSKLFSIMETVRISP